MRAYVQTPAASEPIDSEQAEKWLRLDSDVAVIEVDLLHRLVTAAREYCENYCDRAFASQDWVVVMDTLAECALPGGCIGAVKSIEYRADDGSTATVPPEVYTLTRSGRLRLNPGQSWPVNKTAPDAVSIIYEVGSQIVPDDVVQAMRMLLAHYYEERRSVAVGASAQEMPLGVHALLARHRMMAL